MASDRRTHNGMVAITPPPLSSQSMADLLCTIMLLCRGNYQDGRSFWAYFCIKPSMARAFKEARDHGQIHLEEYGTIIECGDGNDVPADIRERMEKEYGVNHRYEEQLFQALVALEPAG